jgi:formylglycine-generating enzyme required for sulfatase activity
MVPDTFDETHPVEDVSWEDANRVLRGLGLALPSEAQWEYAARAGTQTPWWTGAHAESLQGVANVLDRSVARRRVEWAIEGRPASFDDGHVVHAPVDSFRANPFGLHSTSGNVAEWCSDALSAKLEESRVYRGGSYNYPAVFARSSYRRGATKDFRSATIGVRPVRAISTDISGAVAK